MGRKVTEPTSFPGFPDFRANVTFTPIQFFTVVVPHCSRACVRIVGYALRKVLGWVDAHGNPTQTRLRFTYRELKKATRVSREAIAPAIQEALDAQCLRLITAPKPHQAGQRASTGIYELCWDHEGDYTDSPDDFRGFYYPEAAVVAVSEGDRVVHRPKAARKNIPNAFFDYLLPREKLSVIRVVAALLFYSIEWGPGGERKVPVSKSITELSRLTRMSRQHVHAAVTEAIQRGYLVAVDSGRFDPAAAQSSRAATYAIHWSRDAEILQPATSCPNRGSPVAPAPERSEKVNGATVGKSERKRSEKVNGERSEKVNGISIKKDLKTLKTTAAVPEARSDALIAAAVELLAKAGFDTPIAQRLAQNYSPEMIQRQIDWLPLRQCRRNRLGMLRRAIEEDWPKPEAAAEDDTATEDARTFASHYYAAYHKLEGSVGTQAFPKDIKTAAGFLERLPADEQKAVADWGRRFGRFMREKHAGEAHAKPNLSYALVLHGDGFLRVLQRETAARRQEALGKARAAHEAAFRPRWMTYLKATEVGHQERYRASYEGFLEQRERARHAMSGGLFLASAERLARFDSEPARLAAFAELFRNHPDCPVLDFWQWDQKLNPDRFGTKPGSVSDLPTAEVQP